MAFRRPRVNVKPNVQVARPTGSIARPAESTLETPVESISAESSQQSKEQIETSVSISTPATTESTSNAQETIEVLSETVSFDPLPVNLQDTSISAPVSSSQLPLLPPPPPPPPSSPPPTIVTPVAPVPTPSAPPTRSLFRIKPAPNIGVRSAIHHRRPSASCSGTESESEPQSRPKLASSISITPVNPPVSKPTIPNEPQLNTTSDSSIIGDISTVTKPEVVVAETPEIVHSPVIENNHVTVSTRAQTKVSREYVSQHIIYRAQRLAAKVEPHMTIRKRRAVTLEKLEDIGSNDGEQIDTSKLKIADFVHFNPRDNPMEPRPKITKIDAAKDPIRKQSISSTDGQNSIAAPQLKIDANGTIVVDEASLIIRNIDDTPRDTVIVEGQFNDDNLTHQSYRKIGRRKRWNDRDTLRFYQALRMCGTDFTLIARVFPNRDRDDIKRKFKTEDKANRTLVDSALRQRIPFDLTCFYSPSEDSSENESDRDNSTHRPPRKRRKVKRKQKQTSSSDPLEINRRREKRLQSKKNSMRIKKSAEFINDDDDESSMDVADTVEVTTTAIESKFEQMIPSSQNEENNTDNSISTMDELGNILGQIDEGHLLFVHNTDETGLDRIDVHVVMPNTIDNTNEQSI